MTLVELIWCDFHDRNHEISTMTRRKFLNQKKSKIYPHILIFGQDILIHSRKQLVFWRVPLSIRACPYWAHVSGSPNCHQIQSVLCTGGLVLFHRSVSLLGTFLFVNENTLETLPSELKVKSVEEINAQSVTKTGEIFALSICDASGVKFTILSTFLLILSSFCAKIGLILNKPYLFKVHHSFRIH